MTEPRSKPQSRFSFPVFCRDNAPALVFSFVIFIFLPFVYSLKTADPELHLRYFYLSVFVSISALYFALKPGSVPVLTSVFKDRSVILFAAFFLISALSVTRSVNPGDAWYEVSKTYILLVTFIFLIYSIRKSGNPLAVYTHFANLAVVIFSLISVLEFFSAPNDLVVSTFANKNFYAEALFLFLPFALSGCLFFKGYGRIAGILSLLLIILTITLMSSVSVWLATIVYIFIIAVGYGVLRISGKLQPSGRRSKLVAAIVLVMLITGIFMLSGISSFRNNSLTISNKITAAFRYLENDEKIFVNNDVNANSLYERLLLIRNSCSMIAGYPVTGNGMANWKILFPKYGVTGTAYLNQGRLRFEHPHNDYLLIWSEQGIFGLLAWLGMLAIAIMNMRKIARNTDVSRCLLMLLIFAGVCGFMTMSLFGYPKERLYSAVMLLLIIALPAGLTEQPTAPARNTRWIIFLFPFLCLAASYIQLKKLQGETWMNKAIREQKAGNPVAMRRNARHARSYFYPLDGTSTPVNWYLGYASYHNGEHDKAFEYYKAALPENPYHLQVLNDLASLYEKKGNRDMAIELYKRALTVSSANTGIIMNLSASYYNSGKVDEAIKVIGAYPEKSLAPYKKQLRILLIAQATEYVRSTSDTALADYLSRKLEADEDYLMSLYEPASDLKIPLKDIAAGLSRK